MNILLFTTSMILLLTALTYARLETYRSFSIVQGEFNYYMAHAERGMINQTAKNWYTNSAATRSPNKERSSQGKGRALSRLSLAAFIDSKKQGAYQQELPQLTALAKKLISTLYKDQRFFQDFEQKRPDFVSALLSGLMIADSLPKEQKLMRTSDLANLNLQDVELNTVFYLMLQGTLTAEKEEQQEPLKYGNGCDFQGESGEEEDEAQESGKSEEVNSPQGTYSLLDFITLQEAAKVRVYLAPRPLLMAIFDDAATVSALIEARCHLYRAVINKTLNSEQATQNFRSQFLPSSKGFDETILDFSVTKTNPRHYSS